MTVESPNLFFASLHKNASTRVAIKLFTVMVIDNEAGLARRAYTSHPEDYPITGSKPVTPNRWSDQVLKRKASFVANSTSEFADVFSDYRTINSLGCEAVLNVPIVHDNRVIGTLNFLDSAGHFTAARVVQLETLAREYKADIVGAMYAANSSPV